MRPLVIHLADSEARMCFETFFTRDHFHDSLQCGPFEFDPKLDIFQDPMITDPDTCWEAHEHLDSYRATHERALIVLDEQWDPSPGAEEICEMIEGNMRKSGWERERFEVIVISPELEAWMWQENNPNVADAFRYRGDPPLRKRLQEDGLWPDGVPKPSDPKEAVRRARIYGKSVSIPVIFKGICSRVSVKGCKDPAFLKMVAALQRWFPPERGVA